MTTDDTVYEWGPHPRLRLVRRALGEGRALHWLEQQDGVPGVVVVVQRADALLLIRQQRPAIAQTVWQFPRGYRETSDPDAIAAATREFAEETGLVLRGGAVIGRVWIDPGILSTAIDVVAGHAGSNTGREVDVGAHEGIDAIRWLPLADLDSTIARGDLTDGITLAALAVWRALRDVRPPS